MKRYFCEGKEITATEAAEIEKKNKEYFNSGDFNEMLKIKFVIVSE